MKFFIASKGAYDVICNTSPLRSSEVINAASAIALRNLFPHEAYSPK